MPELKRVPAWARPYLTVPTGRTDIAPKRLPIKAHPHGNWWHHSSKGDDDAR